MKHSQILTINFILLAIIANSQTQGDYIYLNRPLSAGKHTYEASKEIGLQPGFIGTAEQQADFFLGKINPYLVFPPEEGEFGGPISGDGGVVGSISGSFSVSDFGQANYSIPISLPMGIGNMTPNISISYSGSSANSLLGIGWNMTGLSSITRTATTIWHDGFVNGIDFNTDDRFVLDGQRLLNTSYIPYGENECEYRTEIESFVRVYSYKGVSGTGPEKFKVLKKDGSVWYYGYTPDSRIEPQGQSNVVHMWLINKIEDQLGNYIEYSYSENNSTGEVKITSIKYTGYKGLTESENIAPFYEVRFEYNEREDREFYFVADSRIELNKKLNQIKIVYKPEESTLYTYSFEYEYDNSFSVLKSVLLSDNEGKFHNPTKFYWTKPNLNVPSDNATNCDEGLMFPGDFNGDGFADLIRLPNLPSDGTYSGSDNLQVLINNKSGNFNVSGFELDLGENFLFIHICDIDGDTKTDFLYCDYSANGGYRVTPYKSNGNGTFVTLPGEIIFDYLTSGNEIIVGDFLGFGKSGYLIKRKWMENNVLHHAWKLYYLNETGTQMSLFDEGNIESWGDLTKYGDFNGDGKLDILVVDQDNSKIYTFNKNENQNWEVDHFYDSGFPTVWQRVFTGDFNGDGKTDLLNYMFDSGEWFVSYFTGTGFAWPYLTVELPNEDPGDYQESLSFLNYEYGHCYRIYDSDGNGKDDIVTFHQLVPTVQPEEQPVFKTEMKIHYFLPNKQLTITNEFQHQTNCLNKNLFINDYTGDGKPDVLISENNVRRVYYIETSPGQFEWTTMYKNTPSLLKSSNSGRYNMVTIINGVDERIYITYDRLTNNNVYVNDGYYDYGSSIFDATFPLNVVKDFSTACGPDGIQTILYKYFGAKLHTKGKGFFGFTKIQVYDYVTDYFHETQNELNFNNIYLYPKTKTVYFSSIGNSNRLKQETFKFKRTINWKDPRIYFPELENKLTHIWERPGVFQKTELRKYTYYETEVGNDIYHYIHGNLKSQLASYSVNMLYENSITYEHSQETTFTYNDDPQYTSNWLVSLIKDITTKQTKSDNPSEIIEHKTTNLYYPKSDGNDGYPQLWKTTDQPEAIENHPLIVEYEYAYDKRGNLTRTRQSAPFYEPHVEESIDSVNYSPTFQYRFPTTKINAIGYTSTSIFDSKFGVIKTAADQNDLIYSFETNPLGTFSKTVSPEGIISTTVKRWADGNDHNPGNAMYYTWSQSSSNTEELVFYHQTGFELRRVTRSFDGKYTYIDKLYDGKGRLLKKSLPYFKDQDDYYTEYDYDDFGRITTISSPDKTVISRTYNNANEVVTTISNGTLNRTSTKKYNALGWLDESKDNANEIVKNEYFADGKLRKSYISSNTATTVSIEYDARRNRKIMIDPNYGSSKTKYNPFGQVVQKITPKSDTTNYKYDKLGRMLSETGKLDSIKWIYSDIPGRLGTLERTVKPNHSTEYAYDTYLRTTSITEFIADNNFQTSYEYDKLGRVFITNHPSGVCVKNTYNSYGYLTAIFSGKSSTKLWKTDKINAAGMVTHFNLGNGLNSSNTYNPLNLQLTNALTIKPGSTPIQDMEYNWYGLGNLELRKKWINRERNIFLEEKFFYDGLDRLTNIKLNDVSTGYYIYDALGNNTYMYSDGQTILAGTEYGENGYGPHALTSATPTSIALTGLPQHIDYNEFDKARHITQGSKILDIQYGHHKERITQQYSDNTHTINKLWAGACEYITINGLQYIYTYLSGPVGIFAVHVKNPDQTENIRYIHTDHLGSWQYITDESCNILEEQSFDAWGNRRDPATWRSFSGTSSESLFDRGFTGHEHLYAFNLINMNGRLYDPIFCRMLSPDNYVQSPDYSQSFNRYSYCLNNPLKYTDPTGEFVWAPIIIGAAIGAYSGGVIANEGKFDPTRWDFNSGKTWGYMLGGAVVGGFSGYIGGAIAATDIPMSNTLGIVGSSFTNSLGTSIYTGGQTDIQVSLGVASYNFSNNEVGYLGKEGNSIFQDIGYGLGAITNIADIYRYYTWDALTFQEKVSKLQRITSNENIIYDPNLESSSQYDDNTGNIILGKDGLKKGLGWALSSYQHEFDIHRMDHIVQPTIPPHITDVPGFKAFLESRAYRYELDNSYCNGLTYQQYNWLQVKLIHYSTIAGVSPGSIPNYTTLQWLRSILMR